MKQIGHLITVSMKYFLDIDPSICNHTFMAVLIMAGITKLLIHNIVAVLHDGILTVKEDAIVLKDMIATYRERLSKNDTHTYSR